jgi:glycosyltransferase involved in cell wall biosynthesis
MRVLMLSYYYPPHAAVGATRAYLVSRHLALRGHEVTVLAATPQPGGVDETKFPDWAAPLDGAVKVVRGGRAEGAMAWLKEAVYRLAGSSGTSGGSDYQSKVSEASRAARDAGVVGRATAAVLRVARSDLVPEREMSWNPEAVGMGLREIRAARPDVIYVCARPFVSFYAGALLKAMTGIPLVLDLRDPWSLLPHHDQVTRTIARAQERPLFAYADKILINTRTSLRRYQELYGPAVAGKLFCVPNAMSDYPSTESSYPDNFVVMHGGNLYRRSITPLLEAFERFVTERDLDSSQAQLRQVGRIDIDTFDPDVIDRLGDSVRIEPFVPFADFQRFVQEAAVLVVLLGPEHWLRIPAKFYECLAAGRAVLFLGPSDHEVVAVLEDELECGVGANAGDSEDLYRALVRLYDEILPRLREGGVPRERLRAWHWESRIEEIEAVLFEVSGGLYK